MSVPIQRYRFSVDQYHELAEAGVLGDDARVELIEGEIVMMTPIGPAHAACVDRLNRLLTRAAGDDAIVRVQSPVRLSEESEPEPDVSLLRPRDDFYAGSPPGPEDLLLVIEIADSSLAVDRDLKLPLYARAGVCEVWIVDLGGRAITAYRSPGAEGFAEARTRVSGEAVQPLALLIEVPVERVLP